jgi:Ca-activated chloride channel family protein
MDTRAVPLSTTPARALTGSYEVVNRLLQGGLMPAPGDVRIEELINFFTYDYEPPLPESGKPFALHLDAAECPWNPKHTLMRIAVRGRSAATQATGKTNLVFVLDVTGPNRVMAAKSIEKLKKHFKTPGGVEVLALENKDRSAMWQPLKTAYEQAGKNFIEGGINRVILCTEGNFHKKVADEADKWLAGEKAESIPLTVLGFGMNRLRLPFLERLAQAGNGICEYVDSRRDCDTLLCDQIPGAYEAIADDARLSVEFNPARVGHWRLIGCHETAPPKDGKRASDILAGHTYTALYEVVPAQKDRTTGSRVPLKYQVRARLNDAAHGDELLSVSLAYTPPGKDVFSTIQSALKTTSIKLEDCDEDFRFAAAVAGFGMILRNSRFRGGLDLEFIEQLANASKGKDPGGYRAEFIFLVKKARELQKST